MEFSIVSSISNNSLRFSSLEPEYVTVDLSGVVSASVRVCTYTDENGISNWLNKLASFSKPWKSVIEWQSLESQFSISATCSSLGEVRLSFQLSDMHGHPEEWHVTSSILTDFGQLPVLAKQAERFFNHART
ncbi:hypothetical protein ALT761_02371 [Alteromonas sp. 76-1]|jgi:hypothetical protein|uniref:DUF6228 family protein n=1 Tax=Alteromonas TaxID=226 RepID=UPI000509D372|nr:MULTISPECIES: DUF6228 family protein [Alteromonas]APE00815.1 hypothetical protein BM526_02440 [Alteromonas mediterranea]VEL97367.1 hypothetical protein ALT761_02371 [Alteromonas sp. 76-1]